MNYNVIEKYESNLRELQDKLRETIYNRNMSQLGHYDPVEDELRKQIDETNRIINVYNSIMSRINGIDTNLEETDIERLKDSINFEKRNLPSDLVSVIDNKLSKIGKRESFDSVKEGSYQWYLQKRAELQKIARDSINTTKLGMGVNRPSEEIEQQLIEINRIINTYNNLLMNIRKLRYLHTNKPVGYEEEVNRLSEIVKRDKTLLPEQLVKEIEEYFNKVNIEEQAKGQENNPTSILPVVPEQKTEKIEEYPTKELGPGKKTEPQKVKSTKKWNLTPKQKKVLIAVGIATVVAAVVIATQALIPAMAAASHAASVSSTAATMVNNATLWHSVGSAMQAELHKKNIELVIALHNLTGQGAVYHLSSGLWSIGGMELGAFATQAASVAAAASAKVAAISATAASLGIAGLGAIGTGIFKKNKNEKEKEENKSNQSLSEEAYNFYNEQYLEMKDIFKEKGATIRLENSLHDMLEDIEKDKDLNTIHRTKLRVKVELLYKKIGKMLDKKEKEESREQEQRQKEPTKGQDKDPNVPTKTDATNQSPRGSSNQENSTFKRIYDYLVELNNQIDIFGVPIENIDSKRLMDFYDLILNSKELTIEEKNKLLTKLSVISEKVSKVEGKDPNLGGRSK